MSSRKQKTPLGRNDFVKDLDSTAILYSPRPCLFNIPSSKSNAIGRSITPLLSNYVK